MNTAGTLLAEYTLPTIQAGPCGLCVGPDGSIWFQRELGEPDRGCINRSTGAISAHPITTPTSGPTDICTGPGLTGVRRQRGQVVLREQRQPDHAILDPQNPPPAPPSNGTGGAGTNASFLAPLSSGGSAKCGLGASGIGLLALLALIVLRLRARGA